MAPPDDAPADERGVTADLDVGCGLLGRRTASGTRYDRVLKPKHSAFFASPLETLLC